jgi:hypothetical protein
LVNQRYTFHVQELLVAIDTDVVLKTATAKHIAQWFGLKLGRVEGDSLINSVIGESPSFSKRGGVDVSSRIGPGMTMLLSSSFLNPSQLKLRLG